MEMAVGIELLQHENEGLHEAIKVKNKRTAAWKQMAGDPQGVAVFYSPTKVANWRQEQQQQAQVKEDQQAQKAAQRAQQALDKQAKQQQQQERKQQREERAATARQQRAAKA
ncbi:MAG: hypothetical protein M1822_003035 [Bathelium mastoideum]|nr:MAG: hypothetical protein M1822_003035 [Bathelium mastoideum]